MKKISFKKRLSCSLVAVLSLFAVCGNSLHAADITYHWGIVGGTEQTQAIDNGAIIAVGDMGFNTTNYVLIGWNTNIMPIVTTAAMETYATTAGNFYAVGSSLPVTGDMTLYAIWALDKNKDGVPDYNGKIVRPAWDGKTRIGLPVDEDDDGTSLRSLPEWNNNYNLTAYYDSVYHVGCMYNVAPDNGLYEPLITFNDDCFNNADPDSIKASIPLNLVIEYGGVLLDSCMIGGAKQKPLTVIKMPVGTAVADLLGPYPFMFNAIEKDGQGILKMYFVKDDGTGDRPSSTDWDVCGSVAQAKWGPGVLSTDTMLFKGSNDTLTIKFNIYNKPEFKSEVIGQTVDLQGNIDLKLQSGTPLKYMMRCINGLRWKAADSPLSNAEKGEIGNGVSICLRELDQTIGYQMFQKEFYMSAAFDTVGRRGEFTTFYNEKLGEYNEDFLASLQDSISISMTQSQIDSIWNDLAWGYNAMYAIFIAMPNVTTLEAHNDALAAALQMGELMLTPMFPPYTHTYTYDPNEADSVATSEAVANWQSEYGKRMADAIVLPPEGPCREMFCLAFETKVYPTIMREVSIPQVSGATIVDIGYGTHYVASQGDFTFSVKYASEPPMTVTTNRIVDGVKEELVGTLNAAGEYEYVIRRVTQNIVLTFSVGSVDNTSVMGGTVVWSHDNTIYIRVAEADAASIYSIAGRLVKRIELPAGETPVLVDRGVYIVTLKDGLRYKVVVK